MTLQDLANLVLGPYGVVALVRRLRDKFAAPATTDRGGELDGES